MRNKFAYFLHLNYLTLSQFTPLIPFLHFSFDQPVLLFFVVYEGTETFKCDETISSPELGNYCSFASRTAVLYCLAGYTLSALIAILHEICLDALQVWGARGRRGAALDLYALAFLLIGGVSVLYSSSTRFSSFINFLVSRVVPNDSPCRRRHYHQDTF